MSADSANRSGRSPFVSLPGKTAFVTGAASGIGLALVKRLLHEGMQVVATDIDGRLLRSVVAGVEADGRVLAIPLDVTDREAFGAARDQALDAFGAIHLLCANAGVGGSVPIDKAEYRDWDWVLGVNLGGSINAVVTVLPSMLAHDEPAHVLLTGSMTSLMPHGGGAGIYSVSKHAVRAFGETLRDGLASSGIGVSVLCPGLVRTDIGNSEKARPAHLKVERPAQPSAADLTRAVAEFGIDPADVAAEAVRALRDNEPYIITHPEFRAATGEYFAAILDAFDRSSLVAGRERKAAADAMHAEVRARRAAGINRATTPP